MGPVTMKRCCMVGGAVLLTVACCLLLLVHNDSGDPSTSKLRWTYRDLLRGPLVLTQDDPIVIQTLQLLLQGPSSAPYALKHPEVNDYTELGQLQHILEVIGGKTEGTFVEAGAFDGEIFSNTLFLERFMNWTGVLVEAENWNYRQLLLKHRKARTLNVCLSPNAHPQQFGFEEMPGSIMSYVDPEATKMDRQIRPRQCFPLYSVLAAAGLTSLDLLSLDVEGIEYLVLNTIPWDKVDIKIVLVDYVRPDFRFDNGSFDPILEEPIKKLMFEKSYKLFRKLDTDLIFVKNNSEYDTLHGS